MFAGIGIGVAEWLAKSALMTSPFGGFLKGVGRLIGKIPWQVWAAIALAFALWLGVRWHNHEIHKLHDEAYKAGYGQALADTKAEEAQKTIKVEAITNEGDGQSEQVNRGVQQTYAKDIAGINATADRLRRSFSPQRRPVSVPGPDVPDVSGSTVDPTEAVSGGRSEDDRLGGSDQATAGPEPTINVPALELIDRAVACDTDHAQVKAWWVWYDANEKIYKDWVAKVQKATQPEKMDLSAEPAPSP